MNLDEFIEHRRPNWQQLESLLTQARRNLASLSAQEVEAFGRLYRLAASDLALAQRDFPRQQVTAYLNQLVGQTHSLLYRGEPFRWHRIGRFFSRTFPQLYRVLLPYTIVAFALFLLPALLAFFVVLANPDAIYVFEGPGIRSLVRDVEGRLSGEEVADELSALADAVMDAVLRWSWANYRLRHRPSPALAVIAYGKLGGKELGYGSDLDVVFLYDDADEPHKDRAQEAYAAFVRKIIACLTENLVVPQATTKVIVIITSV